MPDQSSPALVFDEKFVTGMDWLPGSEYCSSKTDDGTAMSRAAYVVQIASPFAI